jgi:hypothetical protein
VACEMAWSIAPVQEGGHAAARRVMKPGFTTV